MAVIVNAVGRWDGKDIDRATRQLQKLGKDAGVAGRSGSTGMSGLSRELKGVVAVGGVVGAGLMFKRAIDSAGELQDTVSAAGQVFGEQQAKVVAFGQNAAKSMGLSENAAIKAATSFAVFAKSAGLGGNEATSFSTTLTQLAGDMASFYGGSVEDAVTAIGSALRGEQEPIRRYNVLLDDATLRQEALSMGLIKTTKDALTPQQKVLAANAAILKQTTVVQGDYNRTADQFSNVQRTMQAELENTTTSLATGLLPVATDTLQTTRSLVEGFNAIPAPVKVATAVMGISAVVARKFDTELGAVSKTARDVPTFFSSIGTAWKYAGQNANSAAGGVATLGQRMRSFRQIMGTGAAATNLLKGAGSGLMSMLGGPWGIAIGGATLAVTAYMNAQQNAQQAVDGLTSAIDGQTGKFTESGLGQISKALHDDLSNEDVDRLKQLGVNFGEVTAAIAEGGPRLDATRQELEALLKTQSGYARTTGPARAAIDGLLSSIQNQSEVVYDARRQWESSKDATAAAKIAQSELAPVMTATTRAAQLQKDGISDLTNAFKTMQGILDRGAQRDAWATSLKAIGKEAKEAKGHLLGNSDAALALREKLRSSIGDLTAYANGFTKPEAKVKAMHDGLADIRQGLIKNGLKPADVDKFLAPLVAAQGDAKAAGEAIATGVAAGIAEQEAAAIAQAKQLGAHTARAVRDGAEVNSPSKITIKVGHSLVEGVVVGVQQKTGGAQQAIKDATAKALEGAQAAVDKFRQRGQDALSFIDSIRSGVTSFGSVAGFDGSAGSMWGTGSSASDVTGQMRAKVEQAKAFAKDIEALRKMGLNNASIQEIIGAGPTAGDQIARALLAGGKSAVGEVNSLESQLNAAAASIGDTGGTSQYGLNRTRAKGMANTRINANFQFSFGNGITAADKAEIERAAKKAVEKAFAVISREYDS